MEIKTCEQYVVARITELEEENSRLNDELVNLALRLSDVLKKHNEIVDEIEDVVSVFKKHATFNGNGNNISGLRYIEIECIWEKFDTEDFNKIAKVLDFIKPENDDTKYEEDNEEDED